LIGKVLRAEKYVRAACDSINRIELMLSVDELLLSDFPTRLSPCFRYILSFL
jgi:hypothetical protein